ncbi:MAG: urease accessory protein UreD [Gammaproteobacteria bacterium]
MVTNSTSQALPARAWAASITLAFKHANDRTILHRSLHQGPLRVQRTFNEADGSCHVYLLHPPGGVVGGDSLDIGITAADQTDVVLTTPAAGKFYRCLDDGSEQRQLVTLQIGAEAHFEWLPQETIFFNGARSRLQHRVRLSGSASYIGWEILSLGRRASGETFRVGSIQQSTTLLRDDQLIHRERLAARPDNISGAWSFAGQTVSGTLVAASREEFSSSRADDRLQGLIKRLHDPQWGVTAKAGIILVRHLGNDAEHCRQGFEFARDWLTAAGMFNVDSPRQRPRIWST